MKLKCSSKIFIIAFLGLLVVTPISIAAPLGIVEFNGKSIIINDDNTWEYSKEENTASRLSDCTEVKSGKLPVTFCLDEKKWHLTDVSPASELQFKLKGQELYVLFIPEEKYLENGPFRDAIMTNAQEATGLKPVEVLAEDIASVGGTTLNRIKYRAHVDDLDITYENYYSGIKDLGSLQIIFFGETAKFESYANDIKAVVSDIVISQ